MKLVLNRSSRSPGSARDGPTLEKLNALENPHQWILQRKSYRVVRATAMAQIKNRTRMMFLVGTRRTGFA